MSDTNERAGEAPAKPGSQGSSQGANQGNDPARNQGEGDREAARRYNQDAKEFVQSGKVEAAVQRAKGQDPAEAEAAEKAGKARAKEFDPSEARDYSKPDKA